jgi:hypothetical protein
MNPRLPRDWIARERSRLNELEAAAELDGLWSEDGARFFPRALLESATADVELGPLLGTGGDARGVLGMDYGVSFDSSTAVGLFRLPVASLNGDREFRPVFVAVPHVWEQGAELRRVVEDVAGCRSPFRFIGTEVNGVGAMPSAELRRAVEAARPRGMRTSWAMIATSAPSKLASYSLVRWLLERGQLVLPREPALLRQLAGMRLEQSHTGTRIGAEDAAVHDDVADALSACMLPFRARGGRLVCGLASLADPVRALPDAELPDVGASVAVTGGGLRVFRDPPLQSVAARELTLPPSLAARAGFDRERPRGSMEVPIR